MERIESVSDTFKCIYCNHTFDEKVESCPYCGADGDDIIEVEYCNECHEHESVDEIHEGVCYRCVHEEFDNDINTAFEIAETDGVNDKVYINSVIPYFLSEEQIDKVLKDYIINNYETLDPDKTVLRKFIDDDIEWYIEQLIDKKKFKYQKEE